MNKKNVIVVVLFFLAIIVFVFFKNYSFTSSTQIYSMVLTKDGFSPEEINIRKGDTVIFTSNAEKPFWPASDLHPTHGIYPEFDPRQPIESGQSWSFKFNKEGE